MLNQRSNMFRFFFAGMDLFALNAVHLCLLILMHRIDRGNNEYTMLFLVSNMAWLLSAYINGIYTNGVQVNFESFTMRSVKAFLLFSGIMLLFIFIYHFSYSRLFVLLDFAGFGLAIFITRVSLLSLFSYLKKRDKFSKRIVFLGYNEVSKKLVNNFLLNNWNLTVEGYFEDPNKIHELSLLPILGDRNECINYAVDNKISEIYSTVMPDSNPQIYEIAQVAETNMIKFKFIPDFSLAMNQNVHIDFVEDIPILSFRPEPLEDISARIKKRIFDLLFSFLVITLVLSWLLPILAILIKLTSKGPVFFTQDRSGKDNRPFRCYKLRTLRVNPEADIKQVTKNDRRITKLGGFLRRSNLDELPQFFNVFMGSMSVVGPRPHMLKHTEDYSKILTEYMIRHYVKPGVTGWAQINGYRGEIREKAQLRKRIEHDIWYMENWSIFLDIRIIFLTLYGTFRRNKQVV